MIITSFTLAKLINKSHKSLIKKIDKLNKFINEPEGYFSKINYDDKNPDRYFYFVTIEGRALIIDSFATTIGDRER